jgi:hypothetical protein
MSEHKLSVIFIGDRRRERKYFAIVHNQQWSSGVREHYRAPHFADD